MLMVGILPLNGNVCCRYGPKSQIGVLMLTIKLSFTKMEKNFTLVEFHKYSDLTLTYQLKSR